MAWAKKAGIYSRKISCDFSPSQFMGSLKDGEAAKSELRLGCI